MTRAALPPPTTPLSARQLLAMNLLRLRTERGWSQEALGFEAGLHRTFVGQLERCVRNVSIDNVERLAVALGLPVHELLKP